jgi:Cft2 family RNA processing exonuclease
MVCSRWTMASSIRFNDVTVSLHPAGHILGSAQVRVERRGEVWVFTGDYKTQSDPTCEAFELVPCDTLITEATFGLPIYRWLDPHEVFAQDQRLVARQPGGGPHQRHLRVLAGQGAAHPGGVGRLHRALFTRTAP